MARDDEQRRQEQLELVRKSRDALDAEHQAEVDASRKRRKDDHDDADGDVVMYRGQPVGRQRTQGAPGAGVGQASGRQFRGAKTTKGGARSAGTDGDVILDALRKLKELHRQGLITESDYEKKKQQLLDRL